MAVHQEPGGDEPPQVAAWYRAVLEVAVPLLAAAQDVGAVRADLGVLELMALTTAVARAGNRSQAGRLLDVLLEGVVPR